MQIVSKGFTLLSLVVILFLVVSPASAVAVEASDIEAATIIAKDAKYKIELAVHCGKPITSQPSKKLERFAVALDLNVNGYGPKKLSQVDFENVMAAASTPESAAAITKRAIEASSENECNQSDNIKYWSFLKEAGKLYGN